MSVLKRCVLLIVIGIFGVFSASAQQGDIGYKPSKANLEAREWFQDAKFGLFVHWGIYSILARQEWVMNIEKIPVHEYEKLASQFNPVKFDPDEWCRMVKDAGMHYITIKQTSRRVRNI